MGKSGKMPVVRDELSHLEHVPISSIAPMQGDLKDLSVKNFKKLKKRLIEQGIKYPFYVWENEGRLYFLDGHQRDRVFQAEGWEMDVPIIRVHAPSWKDAKKEILAISSQFGKMTQEGFDEFTFDFEEGWAVENIHIDALPHIFEDWGDLDGDGDGGDGDGSDGSLQALIDVTIDEPRNQVARGEVWDLGIHILVCADVVRGWSDWVKHLQEGAIFAPYCGPFVLLSKKAAEEKIIAVQPDPYIAGHIVDQFENVHGGNGVKKRD